MDDVGSSASGVFSGMPLSLETLPCRVTGVTLTETAVYGCILRVTYTYPEQRLLEFVQHICHSKLIIFQSNVFGLL